MAYFDRNKSLPLYAQVADWVRARVITGEWSEGYKLPPEVDLAKELGISRGTLRRAMELLIKDQVIVQTQGKGTFVGSTVLEQSWAYKLTTTSEELGSQNIPFRTEVIDLQKKPVNDQRILQILQLPHSENEVIYLKRVRSIKDVPVVVHETYFPAVQYMGLLDFDFSRKSMTGVLEKDLGIEVTWAEHTIAAISSDAEISRYLKLKTGENVIYDEHILYDSSDRVIEFTKGWFRGDRFRLKTVVYRNEY